MHPQLPRQHMAIARLLILCCLAAMLPALACAAGGSSTTKHQSRPYIVLLCKASDIPQLPHPVDYFRQMFTGTDKTLNNVYNYFLDESYGAVDIAGTQVKDWLDTGYTTASLNTHDRRDLAQKCADAFKTKVNYPDYRTGGIITIWNIEGADGGATSPLAGPQINEPGGPYYYVNAGGGFNPGENAVSFFTHEMLHTMGLEHAHGPFPPYRDGLNFFPDNAKLAKEVDASNTHTFGTNDWEEYGDCWTIMGCGVWTRDRSGTFGESGPDLGAAQRDWLGWVPNSRRVVWDNGRTTTVTLAPANRPDVDGTLLVKIPIDPSLRPGPCCSMYTVEYIEKSKWSEGIGLDHAVLIHELRPDDPLHTYLVSRSAFGAWLPGQVFLDSASHIRISIESEGATAKVILSSTGPGDDGKAVCLPLVNPEVLDSRWLPSLSITSPLPGAHVEVGVPVTLQVAALDPSSMSTPPVPDPLPDSQITWTSGSTSVGRGSSLYHTFSAEGDYTLQVLGVNKYCGYSAATVAVHVSPASSAASVAILQPVDGQDYQVGAPTYSTTINLAGVGLGGITSLDWIDETSGTPLGSGNSVTATISLVTPSRTCVVEPHTITLQGKTATSTVQKSITITLKTLCIR